MIERFRSWAPYILSIFRFLAGTMFACHGAQKLFGAFGGMPPGIVVPAYITYGAGSLEFFGGILVALGLFTRSVAFILSGLMAVAYFTGHAPNGFVPKVNGGEPAVLYCWLWLFIAAHGPGAWALDRVFFRKRP
jgi:putative oxidoreductase